MSSINKVILVGRTVADVEHRHAASGDSTVVKFRLATDKRGRNDDADFHNVVCFNKLADNVAKYVGKGSLVGIEGRLQTRSWDKDDGTRGYMTEVIAHDVQFLSTKEPGGGGGSESSGSDQPNW